jgi:hypothetical protein
MVALKPGPRRASCLTSLFDNRRASAARAGFPLEAGNFRPELLQNRH